MMTSDRQGSRPRWSSRMSLGLLVAAALFLSSCLVHAANDDNKMNFGMGVGVEHYLDLIPIASEDGESSWKEANRLFALGESSYDAAALHYWRAVLLHNHSPKYTVQEGFEKFMQCMLLQHKPADGLAYVALESFRRGQNQMGQNYLDQALQMDPNNQWARDVEDEFGTGSPSSSPKNKKKKKKVVAGRGGAGGSAAQSAASHRRRTFDSDDEDDEDDDEEETEIYPDLTPAQLYEKASSAFAEKDYELCADLFEISCARSNYRLGPSCGNAVYCRTSILDWGFNGTDFERDMKRIESITDSESNQYRFESENGTQWHWQRASSVHPHMTLGFPIKPLLKRFVTESVAFMDEMMARATDKGVTPLPDDLPYDPEDDRARLVEEYSQPGSKIRVGFVGSGFNSKAVLYLSQDMFRFFDKKRFEIHIFSVGPADNPLFIEHGMRGVDWRQRVINNVGKDRFHDIQHMKLDHIKMARFIKKQDIHILIEWDGYARQGERAQGLFALRPAPIQILHQEYLGTSGAQYVDYLFTDKVSSPPHLQHLYAEKLIYMPNHFFSKGHAVQPEVMAPSYEYEPAKFPYKIGYGSPQENRCMARKGKTPSIVFCNFNKFLKNNPETVRSWIRILREVPDSMLCLLENPSSGVAYLRKFIHEAAGTSNGNADEDSFSAGDGDDLNSRIHFLPWERNPFDHQRRNHDFCNVMLDSYPYNGHTVAQDSLYGGVPIVTRSDGDDMCSRVSTSANIVLGLDEYMNAYEGPTDYENKAIALGNNPELFQSIRKKLIDTCLQRNPMHPYWDVARYLKNIEVGLTMAWERFLRGDPPEHLEIEETEAAKRGTYDDELNAHPPDGPLAVPDVVESSAPEDHQEAPEPDAETVVGTDEL
ncbi:peptide N-acetylglucosaminyltransferase 110 kDa subunit [Seminavis robusta]|uniref:Peptide N-acetylglucosaminyltransferase 110 kDa subunit n=1 Tax=Seminavis robusta TaxID=568900 RepID=A0A9N8EAC6_9STRA|nr:peptide N-acetylglucosaminyltransferase 110 kDa subunit [Seminavis robusta]|eukprot:Sro721_g192790.1 peptide N-acetylglucosaminyltransferase 110 kDa subunit (878) ;mRNA; r:43386-46159